MGKQLVQVVHELSQHNWHMHTQPTAEDKMTQEAADRIKEAEMKKPNPDYDLIRRTQEAAKRNAAQGIGISF